MENNINIAELLKDCPKGMELDCALYDNVFFDGIDTNDDNFPISLYYKHNNIKNGFSVTKYGTYYNHQNTKCVIFPKGKTTWEGFQRPFNNGDIIKTITNNGYLFYSIYEGIEDKKVLTYIDYVPDENKIISIGGVLCLTDEITEQRFATEEEEQQLFDAIKTNGYKWNEEAKTLEKLIIPKFKVGDVIQDIDTYKVKVTEVNIEDECYGYESMMVKGIGSISFSEQDNWELVPKKFDITTLKPFDNCKYSLDGGITWKYAQYWFIQEKYNTNDIDIELWQG